MKSLLLLLLLISGYCLAFSPKKEHSCSGEEVCFSRTLSSLSQAEDEIFQSLNKKHFPELFVYDVASVSFCDAKSSHCLKPPVFFYQQADTGESFLMIEKLSGGRRQIMSLLNPKRQQALIYHVTGFFFIGSRFSDAGLELSYLHCSRHTCREKVHVMDAGHLNDQY